MIPEGNPKGLDVLFSLFYAIILCMCGYASVYIVIAVYSYVCFSSTLNTLCVLVTLTLTHNSLRCCLVLIVDCVYICMLGVAMSLVVCYVFVCSAKASMLRPSQQFADRLFLSLHELRVAAPSSA